MKDSMAKDVPDDRIWSLSIPGRQLYQYANENDFCLHRPERRIQLPKHKQMESTGSLVYNGSLYYQRRNSRRIIRFDIKRRKLVAEVPLKNAGFHGMFAYQWGGYSDVDLAIDQFGLWAIYSSTERDGNIIVTHLNANTLATIKTVHTEIKKSSVANSFVICGVLYTVNDYRKLNAAVDRAFNLMTQQELQIPYGDIPFHNAYSYNTMIDYNLVDEKIYSWDNGKRVVYPVTMGDWDDVDDVDDDDDDDVTTSD